MQASDIPRSWAFTRPALFVVAVTAAWLAGLSPMMQAFEHRTVDLRVRSLAARTPASPEIVLVALDDASLERLRPDLGRWPWPRAIFGAILEVCSDAAVVGFDILFTEPDWQWPGRDQVLAQAVERQGRVVNPVFLTSGENEGGVLPDDVRFPGLDWSQAVPFEWPSFRGVLLPFEALAAAGAGLGHVNHEADRDGVARRYLLAARCNGRVVPSLALAVVGLFLHEQGAGVEWTGEEVVAGPRGVPLTEDGRLLLAYTDCRYPVYSVADVLASWQAEEGAEPAPVPREAFRDKIVLIGSVATGLEADMQVTPVARALPGLVIHANAVDGLLRGATYRWVPPWLSWVLVLVLAGLPFIPIVARPRRMAATSILLLTLYALAAHVALQAGGWMMPVTAPLLGMFGAAGGLSVLYWYREAARRRYLESLEEAKQEFTDMLVHDLKNRVSAIAMSLSMLKGQVPADDEPLQRSIRTSQASASRLLEQVYSLLDIRRMQEGRLALKREPVDVWMLLRDCAQEHEEAGALLKVGIRVRHEDVEILPVEVDRGIFGRILGNLVWNALNHARRGSEVWLGAQSCGAAAVEIVVANEGRSIPPDLQETMFDAFVSGSDSGQRSRGPNFGLGLAFCRLACAAHGASIRIESPWADGTEGVRVILKFPRADAGVAPA